MSLSARGLTLGFGHRALVTDLAIDVAPGQCWAILGNNGSGKTTLLHTLAGIRRPLAGEVALDARLLADLGSGERARAIGLRFRRSRSSFGAAYWNTSVSDATPTAAHASPLRPKMKRSPARSSSVWNLPHSPGVRSPASRAGSGSARGSRWC